MKTIPTPKLFRFSTSRVANDFPLRTGEVLRIRKPGSHELYRTVEIGRVLFKGEHKTLFKTFVKEY